MNKLTEGYAHWAEQKPRLWMHIKSGGIYRTVGYCINKDDDSFCLMYRKWDDFGNSHDALYIRERKNFHKAFEEYEFEELEIAPTRKQLERNMELICKRSKEREKRKKK